MTTLLHDLRYTLRQLRKLPGFTVATVLTLALAIGVNATIFGLADTAFLRFLPFRHPDRLVHIWTIESDGDTHTPTPQQYLAIRESSTSYEQIAATGWADYFYEENGALSHSLPGVLVTPNWLTTLGIEPWLGRNFRNDEQVPGQDAVVLLSYDCWRTRFHADPQIIDQPIVLNRRSVRVIGVLPQFLGAYYENAEIFAPLVLDSYAREASLRSHRVRVQIVGRLRPAVTLGQARSEAELIADRIADSRVSAQPADRLVVEDFGERFRHPGPTVQNGRRGLAISMLASGLVLLIACANVASLLLARGLKRQQEVAVRAALGCSRRRMIRQLLTESAVLFLGGGAVALIMTRWCEGIVTRLGSGMVPGAFLQVNAHVFLVCLGVSLLSGLSSGLIPALQVTGINPNEHLKDAAPRASGGSHSRRLRNTLVAGQVGLGMVLLVAFGLLMRSLLNVESSPLGFDPSGVLTATVRLTATRYKSPSDRARLMRQAIETIRLLPEVESAGTADSLPMNGADTTLLRIENPDSKAAPIEEQIYFVSVGPAYFSTLRVPMLSGHPFEENQEPDGSRTAIINESFAERYFPGTNPVGLHLAFADSPTRPIEIIGVVANFRQRNPDEDWRPLAYLPIIQMAPPRWSVAIRAHAGDTEQLVRRMKTRLEALDPQLYWEMSSMQRLVYDSESLTMRRPLILIAASFGSLAIILIIVGVFAVTSYSVAERTREIAIRVALGAARNEIAALVLREMLAITLAGLAVGAPCAFALSRLFPTQGIGWSGSGIFLYGVSRADGLTYLLAAAVLIGVVLAACWRPARRAMCIDPIEALRYE